tara:strand:- start:204 stop:734 length:531 start_codon:yes stop_codon:yes gene_type:complete
MSYFLTNEQEDELSFFLDRENTKICEDQVSSASDLPQELKDIVQKTIDAGSPIPAFDPAVGYYTVSFTPCDEGNRIYAHHHLSGVNEAISDPLKQRIDAEELAKMEEARKPKPVTPNVEIVPPEEYGDEVQLPDDIDFDKDMSAVAVADAFGGPPKEILDQMTQDEKLGIIDNSND